MNIKTKKISVPCFFCSIPKILSIPYPIYCRFKYYCSICFGINIVEVSIEEEISITGESTPESMKYLEIRSYPKYWEKFSFS